MSSACLDGVPLAWDAIKCLPEDYETLWGAAHPEDPLELAAALISRGQGLIDQTVR